MSIQHVFIVSAPKSTLQYYNDSHTHSQWRRRLPWEAPACSSRVQRGRRLPPGHFNLMTFQSPDGRSAVPSAEGYQIKTSCIQIQTSKIRQTEIFFGTTTYSLIYNPPGDVSLAHASGSKPFHACWLPTILNKSTHRVLPSNDYVAIMWRTEGDSSSHTHQNCFTGVEQVFFSTSRSPAAFIHQNIWILK